MSVIADMTILGYWAVLYLDARRPGGFVYPMSGALGSGIPTALGAVAANPDDWRIPLAVGNAYFNDDKFEEAMKWVEQSIKVKETFQNLATKAQLLFYMGKKQEAVAVGEQAVARGTADGADTTRVEKRLADIRAGKM